MLTNGKQRGALRAINTILVLCRSLATEARISDLVVVLDVAEYLPVLMLEDEDRTPAFRDQLVDLASRYPEFAHALDQFDLS